MNKAKLPKKTKRLDLSQDHLTKQWFQQALSIIQQGQSLNDFVSRCHPDNRKIAILAYKSALNHHNKMQ